MKLITVKRQLGDVTSALSANVLREQASRVRCRVGTMEDDVQGLEVTETIRMNQAVAEYTGNVMLREEYEHDKQADMSFPFVLCYSGLDPTVEVCVDSSLSTNDARYVRCSCTPNAKIQHAIEQSSVRFYICATKNINEGRELTIPFYFDYRKGSACEVKCACGRPACPVTRFFSNKSNSRSSKRRSGLNDDAGSHMVAPPLAATSRGYNDRAAAATSAAVAGKHRRKSRNLEAQQKDDLMVPRDVGADVTLVNKLLDQGPGPSSPVGGGAAPLDHRRLPSSSSRSSTTKDEQLHNSRSTTHNSVKSLAVSGAASDLVYDEGHGEGEAGPVRGVVESNHTGAGMSSGMAASSQARAALTSALEKNAQQPMRKTREQKKIEAVEKAFEKIEKVGARSSTLRGSVSSDSTPRTTAQTVKANLNNRTHVNEKLSGRAVRKDLGDAKPRTAGLRGGQQSDSRTPDTASNGGSALGSRSSSRTSKGLRSHDN